MMKCALPLLLLIFGTSSWACSFDDFPIYSAMKVFPIMSNTLHNNQPLNVKGFRASVSRSAIERFYRRTWDDEVVTSRVDPWDQLSTLQDDCLMTVQLAEGDGVTEGRLVLSNLAVRPNEQPLGQGVLLPDDAVVATDTVMTDGPKKGRVTLLASAKSPERLSRFYRSKMMRRGWLLEQNFTEGDARVLVFRDGPALTNVLIMPAPTVTQVLINSEEPR